uniref:Cytochrome P450 18a1 (inferred by orthology to a D. melanogaster protein) n=1 Tax=Strongyloides venezuelensis TaxID=75913 RepID=A0A0K0FKH5_STRVS
MLDIVKNPPGYDAFIKWKKKYGGIYTYWFGSQHVIAICDYNLMVSTFVKDGDNFSGRNTFPLMNEIRGGENYGLLVSDGWEWREQRRFTIHVFRNFGMGKNLMEERILNEIVFLFSEIETSKNMSNIFLMRNIDFCVASIINNLLFGYRFNGGSENEEYMRLKSLMDKHTKLMSSAIVATLLSGPRFLKYLPIFRNAYNKIIQNNNEMFSFIEKQIENNKNNVDSYGEPTNYVESYLKELKKKENENSSFSMNQLKNVIMDLRTAGTDTTSNTISWGIAYILHNPDVQKKVHEEFDSVINSDRLITIKDRDKLKYTCAVVNETQRMANLIPQNVLHRTYNDTCVNGIFITGGSCVIPQISTLLYDENIFPNPYKFDPDRWFDGNGNLKKIEQFIPFSLGKRQCLGESLAKMELFLIMGNILNRYIIDVSKSEGLPSLHKQMSFTVCPKPYNVSLKLRL